MAPAAQNARPAWYGPVPFGGKPPPIPQGWNSTALPNWNKGFWQPNPFYNPSSAASQPWMPAQAWGQPQQGGANFNPYKRVVKPPSAEYLATELSDNPLGLTNMVPREQLYGKEEANAAQHTPWLWNPTRLEEDDEQEAIITAVYRDKDGHRIGRESRGPAPTRQSSIDGPRDSPIDNRPRSTSQTRHYTEPVVSPSQHNHGRHRYNSEPPPETSLDRRNSIDRPGSSTHSSRRDRSRSNDRRPSSFQYGPSPPNSASTTASFSSVPRASPIPPQPPPHEDGFTREMPLRPTFSTAIIRTPEHYSNSPRRSNSTSSTSSNTTAHTVQPQGSLDSMMSQRMNQLSVGEVRRASELSSSAVNGSSSMSGVSVFVDEPSSMLSPLMMSTPKPLVNRPLGRQHSAPTPLDAIPETSPIPPSQQPPQSASTLSSRHVSPMSSRHVSPIKPAHEAHVTPPNSASSSMHRQSEYYSSASTSAASTPARDYYSSASASTASTPSRDYYSSASASASALSVTTPSRTSPRKSRRKGFWNRRGDHLTSTGMIVYAPPDKAYPEELRGYPAEYEGYKDEFGIFMGYLESRTELEESLPRHGRPPSRPYESFLVYDDQP